MATSRSNWSCLFFQRPHLDRSISYIHLQDARSNLPSTINASVPRVREAFRPTAKVESAAKELPRPASSKDAVGSTNGLSVAIEVVVISWEPSISQASSSPFSVRPSWMWWVRLSVMADVPNTKWGRCTCLRDAELQKSALVSTTTTIPKRSSRPLRRPTGTGHAIRL